MRAAPSWKVAAAAKAEHKKTWTVTDPRDHLDAELQCDQGAVGHVSRDSQRPRCSDLALTIAALCQHHCDAPADCRS